MPVVLRSRLTPLVVAALVLAAVPALFPATATDEPWVGEPTMIGGTGRYDAGEYVYNDYVFDDYGADTWPSGQPNVVSLAATTGDMRYPDGADIRDNASDIAEVRVRPVGDDLQVRVMLQTLVHPSVPALWVSLDGAEAVVTANDPNAVFDVEANTVTFTLPGGAVNDVVSLKIGAGLHDGSGGLRAGQAGTAYNTPNAITTGAPTANRLFDVAFNTRESEPRGGPWNEDRQSKDLAAGTVPGHVIDVGALRARLTNDLALAPGLYVRLFESRQDISEGMRGSFPQYGGRLQPYAMWIPTGYTPLNPSPLVINMHSLSVHHNQYRGGESPSYKSYYEQVGNRLNAIVVTPLGRGPDGWYIDEGLVDTLEVWSDVMSNYSIDRDRTVVTGYSMGGYGTYRLSTMMPDSFASAVSIVGPPGNGIWAYPGSPPGGADSPNFTYPQLESTRHVPFWITQGVLDELVPFLGVSQQAERLRELGHEYRFALHPGEDHLSFVFKDDWRREAAWMESHLVRVSRPHDVSLRVRPASWASDGEDDVLSLLSTLTDEVGARLDGGYWVGDVVTSGTGDVTGVVELTSGGIEARRGDSNDVTAPGVDGPSPYVLTGHMVSFVDGETDDVLSGRLQGVGSLTIDVGRAGLSDSPQLEIETDGPVTVTLVRGGEVVGTASL